MKLPNPIKEMERKLREYYGESFDKEFEKANAKSKTPLGAYNRLNKVRKEGVVLEGAYVGKGLRKDKQGNVGSAWFRILESDGENRRIYLHDLDYAEKLPEEPAILAGVRWTELSQSLTINPGFSSYRTTESTTFEVDDSIALGLKDLTTFSEAVEMHKQKPEGKRDPFFTVFGEIANVSAGRDEEKGTSWLRATVEDTQGTRLNVNLASNLEDIFPGADWLEDYEEVAQNLYHMPVLLNGRIFLYDKPDGTQGSSFVIKGAGWISDITKAPESTRDKIEKLAFGGQ